ncbi:hypothetical protein F5Y18DRAFT_66494 [Xylariaceae sp. FL1019]|nr:hypothetical protein F5Y18DRAFT_66494 [Xylariaceae sp. FL1019]
MCIKTYEDFCCEQVHTNLKNCPTYFKQQRTARGIWGLIFHRDVRQKKDCGRVIPHHLQLDSYCQKCTIHSEQLRAREIGQGALQVRKQTAKASHRRRQPNASKKYKYPDFLPEPLDELNCCRQEQIPEPSVWLPDLYMHPDKYATKRSYARPAAAAAPISPCSRRKGCQDSKPAKARVSPSSSHISPARVLIGNVQSQSKPTLPPPSHPYQGKFRTQGPSPPPAVGLPSLPAVVPKPQPAKVQELRRKKGCVYSVSKMRNQSVPLHQQNLQAIAFRKPQAQHATKTPKATTSPPEVISLPHKSALSRFVELTREARKNPFVDDRSDISFVCLSSRHVEGL